MPYQGLRVSLLWIASVREEGWHRVVTLLLCQQEALRVKDHPTGAIVPHYRNGSDERG